MKHRIYTAVLGAIGACIGMVIVQMASAQAQLWQPADTASYTVLRSHPVWDGEDGIITGEYYALTPDAHSGAWALQGQQTRYVTPRIRIPRTNLLVPVAYDELWLWARSATEGQIEVRLKSWNATSSVYTQPLGTEWQLVRVPLAEMGPLLEQVQNITVSSPTLSTLYVDDIWAVKLGPPPDEPLPEPAPEPQPEPEPEVWGDWVPQGLVLRWKRVSDKGHEQVREDSISIVYNMGAAEVQP